MAGIFLFIRSIWITEIFVPFALFGRSDHYTHFPYLYVLIIRAAYVVDTDDIKL